MNSIDSQAIHTQSVGIDVSEATLEVRVGSASSRQSNFTRPRSFSNTEDGYHRMLEWVRSKKHTDKYWFIMEATGVYYEELAYYLHQADRQVCVLVPNRAKHYAKSLPIDSKTDAIDARVLAQYGLERRPRRWQPGSRVLRSIKALLRERQQLKKQQTQLKNRLHAVRRAWEHPQSSLQRMVDHIEHIAGYLQQIERQLDQLWQSERQLAEPIQRIAEICGLGRQSVLEVVAETNGFALINNRNQLASYSGLDVILDQSGNRQGATKISKRGNAHIRRALYMPALSAIQHNKALKAFYQRLLEKCSEDDKKKAVVAVMRKLLLLIYSLWKSGQSYDPDFHYRQITKTT
ncbi:MAG: IS110 family transposase [Candidatus Halalkalibacterium sp. M3_1C_030]